MSEALLLFPHQLFADLSSFRTQKQTVFLLEDPLFFKDKQYPANFTIQRLVFHRASLLQYKEQLVQAGHTVEHICFAGDQTLDTFFKALEKSNVEQLIVPDPCDDILMRRLRKRAQRNNIELTLKKSPGFLNTEAEVKAFFEDKKSYSQTSFYIAERKKRGVLLDLEGKPRGGKWSFDPQNRKKLPKDHVPPELPAPTDLDIELLQEVYEELKKDFPDAVGLDDFEAKNFLYPTTHKGAKAALKNFFEARFSGFGDYEDAINTEYAYLYHSILSPLINSGLLTPEYVLEEALEYAEHHEVPLNAVEGFVRQIMGWREYMRALYVIEGVRIRNGNFWEHTYPMPEALYTGETGIPPVDDVIQKITKSAYGHHIERLMILGNFMCLCEIAPDAVYTWFMEFFIDAYDWVMVPNVYSMSQYADGGLLTTKPYISSSNYIRKMSDYGKGDWCDVWDGLYWRFIHKHRDIFKDNPRLRVMISHLNRMGEEKLEQHLQHANDFLDQLHA